MSDKIAVIGGGVAGLSAAYALRDAGEVTIFDADNRLGGHANTIEVFEGDRLIGLDTAFIIFNEPSYPNFSKFLTELGVESIAHNGGFNLYDLDAGTQFGTAEFDLDEEQVRASYPERFVAMWREAKRFHTEAPRDFFRKKADQPLGEYLRDRGYSEDFLHGYVVQLSTAVWSIPPERIFEMPASTLIAFFMAHDAEGLGGRSVSWKTVAGGSISYVRKAIELAQPTIRLNQPVIEIRDEPDGVTVVTAEGPTHFDYAVLATHADDALALLANPTPAQAAIECISYNSTTAVLHTDTSVLPADRTRWKSWNFGQIEVDGVVHSWPVYNLNGIQGLSTEKDYLVTLECPLPIDPASIIQEIPYRHPVLTLAVRKLQATIYQAHRDTRVFLAGSYLHSKSLGPDQMGSHEAGFSSGLEAAKALRNAQATRLTSGTTG
ncbi:MAG TPA: FAD-dependent oxidoreductase [Kineosporiaceae bacterium]|nr:FAD-dependent oxidoreductase [Kineosporiaceae bacterium]